MLWGSVGCETAKIGFLLKCVWRNCGCCKDEGKQYEYMLIIINIIIIIVIILDNSEFDAQVSTAFSLNSRQRLLQDGLQLLSHLHVYRDPVHRCHCLPK